MTPTPIRQSAADWCFLREGMDPSAFYRRLRSIGYAGVEMVAPANRAAARDAGLELVTHGGPGMDDGLNRREHHPRLLDGIRAAIAEAAADRIANVIVFSGQARGLSDEVGIDACAEGLAALVPDASRAGITLLLEPLNVHDHPDQHAHRSAYGLAAVRRVGSSSVKLLYDIYHLHRMGDDVLGDVLGNLPWVGHIHIAGSPRRDFPGLGQEIDYARLVGAIHAAGYTGCYGHEYLPGADPLDELARSHELFAGHARALARAHARG